MNDDTIGGRLNDDGTPLKKQTYKERAREYRKATYQKLKAKAKADKLARKGSPKDEARKAKLKEQRREVYLKAKAAHKDRLAKRDAEDAAKVAAEKAAQEAAKQEILRALVTTGDKVKPNLRLVKND